MKIRLTIFILEEIENWQKLSVVGDESLADEVPGLGQLLKGLQGPAHDPLVPCVQSHCKSCKKG